jgi:hypothetical protein
MLHQAGNGRFVSVYTVDYESMQKELSILHFKEPDIDWFNFIFANRNDSYKGSLYDVIYGPVANYNIHRSFIAYNAGMYTKEQTIASFKEQKLYEQITFATEKSLSFIHFKEVLDVSPGEVVKNDNEQFKTILQLLVPLVIREIMKEKKIPAPKAFILLCSSLVYVGLENEKTKLWHLSPLCLTNLLLEELETGYVNFPREA